MTTVAIIQARLGSTRLPGKVLMDIGGKSMLYRVADRVCTAVDAVALTIPRSDYADIMGNVLCDYLPADFVNTWEKDENDVVGRYLQTAQMSSANTIVRITSDCPLIDPKIISTVIQRFNCGGYDYYSNCRPTSTYPDGMDVEVFTYDTLAIANREAKGKEREHVTPYIWNHSQLFKIGRLVSPIDRSHYRMTVDTQEDLDYVRQVYADLGDRIFGIDEILALDYYHTKR